MILALSDGDWAVVLCSTKKHLWNVAIEALWSLKLKQIIWVNYNELTTSSLEIIVSKGNHPQVALIQVSELL